MNRSTRVYLSSALLALAVIVVSINAVLALRALETLDQSQFWLAHTWQVMDTVDQAMSSVKDAESSTRGYLITGDPAYLDPYFQARRDLPTELSTLQKLISDNPGQRSRVIDIGAVIDARLDLLQKAIDERAAGSLDSVRPMVLTGTGKYEMDRIRSLTGAMQQEEQGLLAERSRTSSAARRHASETAIVASTLDLLLIVFVSCSLVREQRLRQSSEETNHSLRMLQRVSDVALTQLPIGELTSELLERVRTVIGADATLLIMRCPNESDEANMGEMAVEAANGIAVPPGTRISESHDSPLRRAVVENRILVVNYPAQYEPAEEPAGHSISGSVSPETFGLRTLLIIPLYASGKVTGVLVAGRHTADTFAVQDEQLLSVVADRIAIALDRAAAYESEREARRIAEDNAGQVRALNAELEERVAQRTFDLEATNKELEAFSYSVSHDLRAPLRTVDGFSLALEEDYAAALDDAGRDFVRRIRTGVQRMGQLIDALLQLSRITRLELISEPVDLTQLGLEIAGELRQENPERDMEFKIQPGLMIDGDPRLLRVGLENLLGNAVKFTGRQPEAVIELGQSAETGEFFVRDNGAGFDQQYVGKLFTAFQRLHGEKDFKGSGIGLATVARVIRRHRGTIRAEGRAEDGAEGRVDHGATFWFTLG